MKSSFFDMHDHIHRVFYGLSVFFGIVRICTSTLRACEQSVTAHADPVTYVVHKSHERLF